MNTTHEFDEESARQHLENLRGLSSAVAAYEHGPLNELALRIVHDVDSVTSKDILNALQGADDVDADFFWMTYFRVIVAIRPALRATLQRMQIAQ